MDAAETQALQQLTDAARVVQVRQVIRTASGWYFTLAGVALIAAVVRLPAMLGFGWLACFVVLILAGVAACNN